MPALHVGYRARRVTQTLTGFDNGPSVLASLARGGLARAVGRDPGDLEFRVHGLSITCPNVAGARVPIYELQVEDAYRLDWFLNRLGDAPRVLDIGGHVGNFSLALTRHRPGARVFAFEPAPTTFGYLRRNLDRNGRTQVSAHQVAVGAVHGTISFTDNGAGSGLNGVTNPSGTPIDVDAITLADALDLATEDLRVDRGPAAEVDLVKMDAEGAEYDAVLAADVATLSRIRRLVMEYHDVPGHAPDELFNRLSSAGLEIIAQEQVTDRLGTAWLARVDDVPG